MATTSTTTSARTRVLTSTSRDPLACDLLIVGGEGDLALRKLYPALYSLWVGGCLPQDVRIFGVARHKLPQEEFLARVRESVDKRTLSGKFENNAWTEFSSRLTYYSVDATSTDDLKQLGDEYLYDESRDLVVYLATPSTIFGTVCEAIRAAGLVRPNARIVVEKPLGEDRASYREVNEKLTRVFEESQVRHFLPHIFDEPGQVLRKFVERLLSPHLSRRVH